MRCVHAFLIAEVLCAGLLLFGCVHERPDNPAFALTLSEARLELEAMREHPAPLERPVIVLGGFGDPGIVAAGFAQALRCATTDDARVSSVAFLLNPTMESAREALIEHARERHAEGDERRLREMEFDLVGYSMGGLVARMGAMEWGDGAPPLRVRRIITIATPHRGAKAAELPSFDSKLIAMRAGSDFLASLDEGLEDRDYRLICYVRLNDGIVGHENAAPEGHPVLWIPNKAYEFSHIGAGSDPRLIADILRRLRNETAYADLAGSPLPSDE